MRLRGILSLWFSGFRGSNVVGGERFRIFRVFCFGCCRVFSGVGWGY